MMHTYELYINNSICDLPENGDITLLFQSPIFAELNAIQSNRSYEIGLPLTGRNRAIFANCDRVDTFSREPYIKLPARLYINGITIFDNGFAVIVSVDHSINIALTWGNVDNFQSLFDERLSELDLGKDGIIAWDSSSKVIDTNIPDVGFMKCNFYPDSNIPFADMRYIHPSIRVSRILDAIQQQQGIDIENYERLYKDVNGNDLVIPLTSNNGDALSNEASAMASTILAIYSQKYYDQTFGNLDRRVISFFRLLNTDTTNTKDPRGIATTNPYVIDLSTNQCDNFWIKIRRQEAILNERIAVGIGSDSVSSDVKLCFVKDISYNWDALSKRDVDDIAKNIIAEIRPISISDESTDGIFGKTAYFDPIDIVLDIAGARNIGIVVMGSTMSYNEASQYANSNNWVDNTRYWIKGFGDWTDVVYPSVFPIAANLPDMSQGEFINQLMKLAGLFAYPDPLNVDTIKLFSPNEYFINIDNGNIEDWSSRIIMSHNDDVSRAEISEFSNDDFGQKNTLNYNNDDDVKVDTSGGFIIDDSTLDKEKELLEMGFSASENKMLTDTSVDLDYPCAVVPIYSTKDNNNVNYSSVKPRILSLNLYYFHIEDIGGYYITRSALHFPANLRFGGVDGIVARKYSSYVKILQHYRLITVSMRLSALDLATFSFSKPIYLSCFGQYFALYSIETSDSDTCEVKLLRLTD